MLAATGKALAANSRSLVVGCCCCLSGVASLACSHRLAFSSISIINNRSLVRLNVSLPHVVLLLLLAANSRSLVVGCCCCLSGVACSHRQSACSQQPFIGCRLLLLPLWCCASLACSHRLAFSSFPIINNRSLVRLNVSLPHVVLLLLQPTAAHWL